MDIADALTPAPPLGPTAGGPVSSTPAGSGIGSRTAAGSTAYVPRGGIAPAELDFPDVGRGPDTRLALDLDEASGRVVGLFIDRETGNVVRQVPPEQTVRLLARAREMMGALFDETV